MARPFRQITTIILYYDNIGMSTYRQHSRKYLRKTRKMMGGVQPPSLLTTNGNQPKPPIPIPKNIRDIDYLEISGIVPFTEDKPPYFKDDFNGNYRILTKETVDPKTKVETTVIKKSGEQPIFTKGILNKDYTTRHNLLYNNNEKRWYICDRPCLPMPNTECKGDKYVKCCDKGSICCKNDISKCCTKVTKCYAYSDCPSGHFPSENAVWFVKQYEKKNNSLVFKWIKHPVQLKVIYEKCKGPGTLSNASCSVKSKASNMFSYMKSEVGYSQNSPIPKRRLFKSASQSAKESSTESIFDWFWSLFTGGSKDRK